MKKKDIKNVVILITFFLLIVFSIIGIKYVNGSTVDWDSQHWIFPEYFRTLFYKTKDLFPSFAFNIGAGENIYNFSYYGLLSPLVLISYAFPHVKMVNFIQIGMLIFMAVSIALMYFWLRKRFDEKLSLIGTLLFLLSGPLIYHTHRHIMFINYMPFLILGLIGVDKYFEKNSKSLLIISTFLLIMSSYYYSVGSILAIVVYGIYKYIEIEKEITIKSFIKTGLKFVFPIIIAIMMAMVLLLPTLYALLNGRANITNSISIFKVLIPKFNITEILYGSYTIGTTSILLIAILHSFVDKKSNKFLSIILSLFIIFPILIYIFSGFMYVRGKVLIPLLPIAILLITNLFNNIKYERNKKLEIALIIVFIIESYIYIRAKQYVFILDLLLLSLTYILTIKHKDKKYLLFASLIGAFTCCLINNYSDTLVTRNEINEQLNNKNYAKLTELLKEDDNIYRVGNLTMGMKNLNRVIDNNYYLTSVYSSLENPNYYNFSNNQIGNEMKYRISTAISPTNNILFNTLLGTKYILSNDYIPIGYENVENTDIYINEKVLPIGFSTSKIMDNKTFEKLNYPEKSYALVNNIVAGDEIVDYKEKVKPIELKYKSISNNLDIIKEDDKYIINSNENGVIDLKLDKIYKNKLLFISFDMEYSERCGIGDTSITINGITNTLSCRTWTYHNKNYNFTYTISDKELKELNIKFTKGKYVISNIKTYIVDYSDITKFIDSIDEFKINKESTKGDKILGKINVTENGYFIITIPYEDKGFKVLLDGKEINYQKVNSSFIGFPINEGHHDIEITYTSPYLLTGMIISIIGTLLFLPIVYSDILKKGR